jgi:hypothetical protein
LGERYLLSSVAGLLADALAALGRPDGPRRFIETESLAADDDVEAQTLWRCARANVLATRGELVEAEALAREAVELLEPTDDVLNQINAFACLASVLLLTGSEERAWCFQARPGARRAKGSPSCSRG